MLRHSSFRLQPAKKLIVADFRSDTITVPTHEMRLAMKNYFYPRMTEGNNNLASELEQLVAKVAGKSFGVYVPSGSMSNLVAIMTHGQLHPVSNQQPEVVVGSKSHLHQWEGGSASSIGRLYVRQLRTESTGQIPLTDIVAACDTTRSDAHRATTSSVALEQTHGDCGGRVLPMSYVESVKNACQSGRIGVPLHLDGARLWNAAAALDISLSEAAAPFDSVSLCLSKGLGAVAGSVLVSNCERFAVTARNIAYRLGGDMSHSHAAIASATHAVRSHWLRHRFNGSDYEAPPDSISSPSVPMIDNRNCQLLAKLLCTNNDKYNAVQPVESNILVFHCKRGASAEFTSAAEEEGILMGPMDSDSLRLVVNMHVSEADIEATAKILNESKRLEQFL